MAALYNPVCHNQFMPQAGAGEIAHAAQLLKAGGVVAFPTETVYGLGANALDADAVARIYAIKGRPSHTPLIVHVASIKMAQSLVATWPELADRLSRRFWPGPLTLVFEKLLQKQHENQALIPAIVSAGLTTVGLRMPAHPVALALIQATGVPLAAPSANRFTEVSPTSAEHVRRSLGSEVDYILDGGACRIGIESTVLSLTGSRPALLRPGGISRAELGAVIGTIASANASPAQAGAHSSPGMHRRHYSPHTPLYLVSNGQLPAQGNGIYFQLQRPPSRGDVTIHPMPQTPSEYAAALFGLFHQADAESFDWIAVDLPPDMPAWEAIQDRLQRAASNS